MNSTSCLASNVRIASRIDNIEPELSHAAKEECQAPIEKPENPTVGEDVA